MSRIIFFDTETTGLPTKRRVSALNEQGVWPDIVSICWWVFDGQNVLKKNYLIRPGNWIIPEDSIKIHGITQAQALAEGSDLLEVLLEFKADLEGVKYLVAHNMEFDKNVLLNAYKWRLAMNPTLFWPSPGAEFCSAQKSKDELKLPSLYPKPWDMYKIPKLDELYQDTFKKPAPSGAHNAERDVDVLQQIVWARWSLL